MDSETHAIGRIADLWANEEHRNWREWRFSYLDRLFEALWLGAFDGAMYLDLTANGQLQKVSRELLAILIRGSPYWPPRSILYVEPANTPWSELAEIPAHEYPDAPRRTIERVRISQTRLGEWAEKTFKDPPAWYDALIKESTPVEEIEPGDTMDRLREFRRAEERQEGRTLNDSELARRAIAKGRNEGFKEHALRNRFSEIGPTPLP